MKKEFVEAIAKEIKEELDKSNAGRYHISTCDTWSYGWDMDKHFAMPQVAQLLKELHGITCVHSVSHQVDDWNFLSKD